MSRLEPKLNSGSLHDFYSLEWGKIYSAVLSILGPTGLILAGGDPRYGQPNATTFKTAGEPVTFTWVAGTLTPNNFATPLDLVDKASFQGIVPIVTFTAAGPEWAATPDAALWSRGDGSDDGPFTIGIWANPNDATGTTLFSKWSETGGGAIREWRLFFDGSDRPTGELYDDSASASIGRRDDTAILEDIFSFLVLTYSGNGANSGLKLYLDADQVDDTNVSTGAYVAMENGTAKATLGGEDEPLLVDPVNPLNAKVALGPCGPGFCHKELTANEIAAWYDVTRRALAY
jgi:hypothetical protein